jgi:site-specific DNA recombinase
MFKESIKVAIYARVSTIEQSEDGFSIDGQLSILKEYCKATGKIFFKEYVDRGVSGKSMKGRLALQQLLIDAEEGLFDEVIVWKINRMARKQLDLLKIVETLSKFNISFRSYSENFETETPMGKFALQMMGAVGELERNTIVDNVKMGMKQRARTGKWNGGIILGYETKEISSLTRKNKETMLAVVPSEAELVKYIFTLYASGKGIKAITNQLNHEGYKTKKGNPFSVNGIKDILHNPTYIGKIRYNVRENWSEKRRKGINSNPILVEGEHDAIIEDSLWEKVQELYSKKSTKPKRTFDGSYPLTGLLRCPECGQGMVAGRCTRKRKDGSKHIDRYYYCGAWRNKGGSVCHANGIRADYAERHVFDKLRNIICNEVVLKDLVQKINDNRSSKIKPCQEELERINKNIKDIAVRREKYFKLFEDDMIDKDLLAVKLDDIAKEIDLLEERKLTLTDTIDDNNTQPLPYDLIKDVLFSYNSILDEALPEQKKLLLQLVIKEITITDKKDIETLKLKFDENIIKYIIENGGSPDDGGDPPSLFSKVNLLQSIRFTVAI